MIAGWLVLMWIWCLLVKIDERGSFLDNVDLNQEPLVFDTPSPSRILQFLQDVSQAPVRHSRGLSIKYPDCGRHYSKFIQRIHDLKQKKFHWFMPPNSHDPCLPCLSALISPWLVPGIPGWYLEHGARPSCQRTNCCVGIILDSHFTFYVSLTIMLKRRTDMLWWPGVTQLDQWAWRLQGYSWNGNSNFGITLVAFVRLL